MSDLAELETTMISAFDASMALLKELPEASETYAVVDEANVYIAMATKLIRTHHQDSVMAQYCQTVSKLLEQPAAACNKHRGLIDRMVTIGDGIRLNLNDEQTARFDPIFENLIRLQISPRVAGPQLALG